MRLGHSFKDYIAPDGMKFLSDHFELGGKVGQVLFMRKYSSYIKDDMITSMADFPGRWCCPSTCSRSPPTKRCGMCSLRSWVLRAILPGGSRGRTPEQLYRRGPYELNSRGRRPRNFWTI